MSGYMVTSETGGGYRNFYMVNVDNADAARDAVNRMMGSANAQALAPVPDETIAHHNLAPGQAWLCTTTGPTGEVTHSELK